MEKSSTTEKNQISQNSDRQDQGEFQDSWGPIIKKFEEPLGVEWKYPNVVIIYGQAAEIYELRKRVEELEEKLELRQEQQIIPIQFLESERLILKQPIIVNLSYSSKSKTWFVDCPELNLYGEGEDEQQAIKDFKIALEESYFGLKKDKENLGPELMKIWNILQQRIEEK
jgi:hypothetical protein